MILQAGMTPAQLTRSNDNDTEKTDATTPESQAADNVTQFRSVVLVNNVLERITLSLASDGLVVWLRTPAIGTRVTARFLRKHELLTEVAGTIRQDLGELSRFPGRPHGARWRMARPRLSCLRNWALIAGFLHE
jgi:hypothetical protein